VSGLARWVWERGSVLHGTSGNSLLLYSWFLGPGCKALCVVAPPSAQVAGGCALEGPPRRRQPGVGGARSALPQPMAARADRWRSCAISTAARLRGLAGLQGGHRAAQRSGRWRRRRRRDRHRPAQYGISRCSVEIGGLRSRAPKHADVAVLVVLLTARRRQACDCSGLEERSVGAGRHRNWTVSCRSAWPP
jgi:hypothetical protein